MVLATSRKIQDKELPLGAYLHSQGVGVVVEGVCLLVVLIGRLGRHETGLVGAIRVLNKAPATVVYEFAPLAVQCESRAPPGLLEENELARPVADVDVEELKVLIGKLRGDQDDDGLVCAGQIHVRAGDEAHGLPRVVGVELRLDWSGRAGL